MSAVPFPPDITIVFYTKKRASIPLAPYISNGAVILQYHFLYNKFMLNSKTDFNIKTLIPYLNSSMRIRIQSMKK